MGRGVSVAVIVAAAALVALLGYGVASTGTDTSLDDALAGGERVPAPELTLPELRGGATGSLADYRGQVVVLNLWASWCPPCVDELPALERAHRRMASRGATVLGVNHRDIPEDALGFVDRFGLTFPNLRDRDGAVVERYGATALPETFVVDRQGRIAARRRGPVDGRWLERTLPPLLAEDAA